MKINEMIVVEGKNDTAKVKLAVQADTIETNGSEISDKTLQQIKLAQSRRGVIVFTDPDFPGEKIRKTIAQHVPGIKHAFLLKEEAKAKVGKGLGIEHASPEVIRRALMTVYEERKDEEELISWQMLIELDFVGHPHAKARRKKLGDLLNIGYMNAKQLHKRLNAFRISPEELAKALEKMAEDETLNV